MERLIEQIISGTVPVSDEMLALAEKVVNAPPDPRTIEQWAHDLAAEMAKAKD